MEREVLFFDLETQRSAIEVGGWENKDLMGLSVAVIYSTKDGDYTPYKEEEVNQLLKRLQSADLIIGFNLIRFDWKVLQPYADFELFTLPVLDLLQDIEKRLGHRLSLNHLAKTSLGEGKIGNGLEAVELYKQGKFNELIRYCMHDVKITKELFEFGHSNGYILYEDQSKGVTKVPVEW